MARREIEFTQGNYYHIFNRGAHRTSIFRDEEDYAYVLHAMNKYRQSLNISFIAYTLLPNHFHWFVRQDGAAPAGLISQRVYNGYTKHFNARYHHSGTIFEGRFKAFPVDKDHYLRNLCCYIHGNSFKHGIADAPKLWPYSNYSEWIGTRNGKLVDQAFITTYFPDRSQYQQRVLDYLTGHTQLPEKLLTYLENLEHG